MLVPLFRKCCRILWKHFSYHQQNITWLLLLVLLSQQQQSCDGKPTKWNHSIQRRFMWKQMDSTVDGFVDRVVTGARVMKGMIGEFMPPKHSSSNVMDYLPTETTRIKYIIRNPHTKETKVIRVRPSKRVVKLMAMTPKPLLADKPKPTHTSDHEHGADKFKATHNKEPEHTNAKEKFKAVYMIDPDKLRQLEKEQELIAEGRIPITTETKPIYMVYQHDKSKNFDSNFQGNDDIVSGRIQEFNESWKPVYKLGDTPRGFTTSKPYMMSALHTSVMGEILPAPQKQVYEPLSSNDFPEEEPKTSHHTYEVTEYTAEESVVQPHTREYLNQQNSAEIAESQFKHSPVTTEVPNIITQIENDPASKNYHLEYRLHDDFVPARGSYRTHVETSTTTSVPSTTTTTEEPNYPAIFLKKLRNRPDTDYNPKRQQRTKSSSSSISPENSWIPSNFTRYTSNTSPKAKHTPRTSHFSSISSPLITKSQKWPPDVVDNYLNSEPPLAAYDVSSTTEISSLQEFNTQSSVLDTSNSKKSVRLKKSPHYASFFETKHRSLRHRGSVKYGDKLEIEER